MFRLAILTIFFALLMPSYTFSKVYMTRDEALKLAFPGADRIEKRTVYLTEDQAKNAQSMARAKLESKLYLFYEGKKGDETLGYAVIDTHLLRTLTETIMVVINPDGTLKQVEVLAFFEPPDYMPPDSWINLFNNKSLGDSLQVGRGIPNITGATITSNSMADSVRRIMAVFEVAVQGKGELAAEGKN